MNKLLKLISLSVLVLPIVTSCSDDPSSPDLFPEREIPENLTVPNCDPLIMVPQYVVVHDKVVPYSASLGDQLRKEADGPFAARCEVNVSEYGQLKEVLGNNAKEIESLAVSGPIDESDLTVIKRCVAEGRLRSVDLSGASLRGNVLPRRIFNADEYYYNEGGVYFLHPPYLPLYELILPEGLISIEEGALANVLLTKLTLPGTLKSIGSYALKSAIYLGGELEFPEGVEKISDAGFLFAGDGSLEIKLPGTVETIEENAFYGAGVKNVIMSEGLLEIERFAFAGSTIETLVLPSTVRNICIYSFRDCSNLKSVYSKITDPSVAYPGSMEDMEDDYEFDMRKFQTPFGDLNNADDSTTPRDIPLYVPSGSLNDYKTTPGWLWFDGTMAEATEFPE